MSTATSFQIGYASHFRTGTITASSESAATMAAANVADGATWSAWQPNSGTAHWVRVDAGIAVASDYAAIYGLRLTGTQAAKIQSSTDGSSWTDRGAALDSTTATGGAVWIPFSSASARYWRLYLSDGSAFQPTVSVLQVGAQLLSETGAWVGVQPLETWREVDALNMTSEGGNYLGRSVLHRGYRWQIELDELTNAWALGAWDAFAEHAESRPFFLAHPPVTATPGECTFAWVEGQMNAPKRTRQTRMSAGCSGRGLR